MTGAELLSDLTKRGAVFSVSGGRLKYKAPPGVMTDTWLKQLTHFKEEIIRELGGASKLTSFFAGPEHPNNSKKHLADDPFFAQLRKAGFLVYPDGEAAEYRMYYSTTILLMRDGDAWELVRARWAKDTPMAVEERRIWRGESTKEAVNKAISYLQWSRSKAGGRT